MPDLALVLALVAAVLSVVELARTRGQALVAWATLALAAIIVLGRMT